MSVEDLKKRRDLDRDTIARIASLADSWDALADQASKTGWCPTTPCFMARVETSVEVWREATKQLRAILEP